MNDPFETPQTIDSRIKPGEPGYREIQSRAKIAERLKRWYTGGAGGLESFCKTEGASEKVIEAARHWYQMGWRRLGCIVEELEREEPA